MQFESFAPLMRLARQVLLSHQVCFINRLATADNFSLHTNVTVVVITFIIKPFVRLIPPRCQCYRFRHGQPPYPRGLIQSVSILIVRYPFYPDYPLFC